MREDFELRDYAKENGFTEEFHWNDKLHKNFEKPHHSIHFKRSNTVIWRCSLGWQIADLINTPVVYANHRPEKTLLAALNKVLEEQR
jgi:hypothetical protein